MDIFSQTSRTFEPWTETIFKNFLFVNSIRQRTFPVGTVNCVARFLVTTAYRKSQFITQRASLGPIFFTITACPIATSFSTTLSASLNDFSSTPPNCTVEFLLRTQLSELFNNIKKYQQCIRTSITFHSIAPWILQVVSVKLAFISVFLSYFTSWSTHFNTTFYEFHRLPRTCSIMVKHHILIRPAGKAINCNQWNHCSNKSDQFFHLIPRLPVACYVAIKIHLLAQSIAKTIQKHFRLICRRNLLHCLRKTIRKKKTDGNLSS